MQATIVVDLGFGDAGKGLITDFLVRKKMAGLVVRYNGGAQAGHNVVTPDGRHHTFSQFGSGTFVPGVKTYLSRYVVIHPSALLMEGDALIRMGESDAFSRIQVSDQCLVITPFHQAANRIHELMRGDVRHGSCGVGVGEAVEDARFLTGDSVTAGDLAQTTQLLHKLNSIRERKRDRLIKLYGVKNLKGCAAAEWVFFEREGLADTWIKAISRINDLNLVTSDDVLHTWLNETENVVFEGAQGVLLDEEVGFHPFTTWSRCTTVNALELIQEHAPDSAVSTIGVMRCYAVRHGPGPLPTQTNDLAIHIAEHNCRNEWQGLLRYGWFDALLSRYALRETGGVDGLAVTHMDLLSRLQEWRYCPGYQGENLADSFFHRSETTGVISDLGMQHGLTLDQKEKITQELFLVKPEIKPCGVDQSKVIKVIEGQTGLPVELISNGPAAQNVQRPWQ